MPKDKQRLDGVLVVDLEATCWEAAPPEGQFNDIIEFGLCYIDIEKQEIQTPESIYVLPTTSRVSAFCENLTQIKDDDLQNLGVPFRAASYDLMEHYKSRQFPWVSWGNYDRKQTERQCTREHVPYPFSETHWNMRDLYCVKRGLQKKPGLAKALTLEDMTFIGQPHSGRDDAYNIARLFTRLILGWTHVI